jgi:Domain of unknown function (DUF2341).
MAFGFYSPISVNAAQVPSTQTDFPMLVSVTDARFKTVSNGGHVGNANGFDIRPYSDSGLTTAITGYELERYNATTGEVVMWVKIASLSSSTTPVYLAYGDSGITTNGSSGSSTFSNSFSGVFHLKDGTTLSITDSTGTISGSNNFATAATGQIDGGSGHVSASTQFINYTTGVPSLTAVTVSAWVKATSFPNAYNSPVYKGDGSSRHWGIFVKSTGKLALYYTATAEVSYDGTGSHTLSTGTWYYLTGTYSSSAGLTGYVNAASDGTASANGNLASNGTTPTIFIGSDPGTAGRLWNGTLDEVRVSSVVRSADWITTEYNNQNAPGTFATLGTEVNLGGPIRNSNWLLFFT